MSKKAKKPATKKQAEKKPRIRVVSGEPETPPPAKETSEANTEPKAMVRTRKKAERKDGTMSGLDAAAKVLTDADQPLNAMEIFERIQAAGLWKTKGKTPQATLYAAIIRELAAKGKDSRFRKAERGKFSAA